MAFFSELQAALDALSSLLGDEIDAVDVPAAAARLSDDGVVGVIERATVVLRGVESVRIAASGVAAARSTLEAGHAGLAQGRGHRSAVSLIQDLTGTSRAEAAKQVRLGTALAETSHAGEPGAVDTPGQSDTSPLSSSACPPPPRPWHAVLGDALMTGTLTSAQHDAIFRGLGAPPLPGTVVGAGGTASSESDSTAISRQILSAWETAATQLIDEATIRTVEELAAAARTIRDLLDPVSATERFEARFTARSFHTWTDRDGARHGRFRFDDEGGAWIDSIINTALRPRRGGPRFIDPNEKTRAEALARDPRTNEQLTYDLIIDILRAGTLTDTDTVFGTRQAGIRIVTTETATRDATTGRAAVALLEDTDTTLPGWLIPQHTCDTGIVPVIFDDYSNPLNLGRETRLYTAKQRLALAIRDGGCRWHDCDRPASYCEAHHIDPYAQGGRTDIDRGILLCRFHHMQLHHGRSRITRNDKDEFLLHHPDDGPPIALPSRLARRYAFGDLKPPPRRFHPAT